MYKTVLLIDFMSLELKDGYPLLLVDYGYGTIQVEQRDKKISDGSSHHIFINFQPNVSLIVRHLTL